MEGFDDHLPIMLWNAHANIFDVDTIIGLRPTGEGSIDFSKLTTSLDIAKKWASFTNFIAEHFDEATTYVFDKENITFLSLWLSHLIFYSNSL